MDTLLLILNFFVFVLSNFVLARFTAIAPDQPVVAILGANAILPCHVSIPDKLTEVRYFKSVHKHLLNLYRDGKVQQECELKEYVGRTELIKDNIGHGSVALKILSVTVADEGVYYCYLQTRTFFDTAKFEIRVTALGSDPRIEIESFQEDRILAVCRSDGWYPKPTVLVKEDDGQTVALNDSKVTFQQQDNLFSVAYPRVITEASNRTLSCLLRTPYHPERMSTLYVADPVFRKTPSPRSCVVYISLFVSILSLFLSVVVAVCCKRRQRKTTSGDPEMVPLKQEEYKTRRTSKHPSEGVENKLTEDNALLEGNLEIVTLKQDEYKTGRTSKHPSKGVENKLTDDDASSEAQREKLILEKHKEQIKATTDPNTVTINVDPMMKITDTDVILTMLMKDNALLSKAIHELKKKQKEKYQSDLDMVIQEKECLKKERDALYVELEMFKMEKRQGKIQIPRAQSSAKSCAKPPPGNTTELKSDSPPETTHAHLQLTDDQKDIKD